jgi:plasmid stabilization system protein ParE
MMRVRWTANAANDLAGIVNYIRKDNPDAARRVAKTIFSACLNCEHFRAAAELVWLTTRGS